MKTYKYYLFILPFLFLSLSGYSRNDLKINQIFEDIGKKQGTYVKLGRDVLSPHTNIVQYQSLRVCVDADLLKIIDQAVEEDTRFAEVVFSSSRKGEESRIVHYALTHDEDALLQEYILFNYKDGYVNLVYLRGNFPSKELKKELKKLRNLFIDLK
ncbi:MAG: hypothetical protein LBH12_00630 [Dysgonamonadaceae bacterium]|jgi:hypothetical protein|nr:hypothetical protein [Dysgonamonadaceae bacterium]